MDLMMVFVTVGKEAATSQDSVPKKGEAVGRLLLAGVGVKSAQSTRGSSSENVSGTCELTFSCPRRKGN